MTQAMASSGQQAEDKINPRIFLLALGMFALGTDANVVSGVLPVIARDIGVAEGLAGQLVTAFSLTYGLGAPFFAALTGRIAPNRVLIGSLGLFGLANIASAISPTFPLLLLTRVLAGCFAASYAPLAYSVGVSLAPPAKRGQALALVVVGLTVATALGSPLGTYIGEHFGWRMSFVMVAALAAVAFLVLLLRGLPRTTTPSALSLQARLAPIGQPRVILALLPSLVWNLGIYTSYTYIAPLLQQNLHIMEISGLLVAFGVGIVCGNFSGGRLADRFGPNRLLIVALIVLAIIQALLSLATATFVGALLILFIWGVTGSMLFIPQQHRLLSIAPEHANVILALNNSAFYLGIAGGAALGGVALRTLPITQLNWIGVVAALLALVFLGLSILLNGRPAPKGENAIEEEKDGVLLPE
ncbi:MFS transporter [Dictyobacter alpinus]|uniref:MFS transporter n=1 Tax=Dictyobacter alpinus TaxID=2014873 RepID=A0A402BCQ9_9CHLR|nr:MFS transporter [Dictyobacter alpinus]GCE29126.1 MFS transporter [Dictyobacter alpinus]